MWLGLSPAAYYRRYTLLCICKSSNVANMPHHPAMWIAHRSACGTEQAPGMLGGQLFGPGGDYHSRILDRWAANPGRREGAIAEEAVPVPERRPLILHSSFRCA